MFYTMKKVYTVVGIIVISIAFVQSCSKFSPPAPAEDKILDGPVEGLSFEQNQRFLAGDIAFNNEIFTTQKGLGPVFVATSCGSCHAGDGKGHLFTTLTRFGQMDSTGNHFLHLGGPQLQNRGIPGFQPEQIPAGASFSQFTPPANTGLGFLDAVTDANIMSMADPDDMDGDGISGVPNWIHIRPYSNPRTASITNNSKYIGRFGKKAATYDLLQQTVTAYNQDIGISSTFEPKDVYTGHDVDPEVSNNTVHNVVFYLQTLKAPIQRNTNRPAVIEGEQIFNAITCGNCHKPILKTGYSPIDALSYKTFFPYTDLLLHDMGNGLDDGYTEGTAKTAEWRTASLWGLGLSANSQGGDYFLLHDGRAHSIEQAILLHGGEAINAKNKYQLLTAKEKQNLIQFLESL
jgi:CxxC motif-containing protein (DUF1111 family)